MTEEHVLTQKNSLKQELPEEEANKGSFVYKGKTYFIDSSKKIPTYGDYSEPNNTVYVDKDAPEKFHEGIAIHEIEELEMLKKGHSYVYSHNYAQKKELAFYQAKYGIQEGLKMLIDEENKVLAYKAPTLRLKKIKTLGSEPPTLEMEIIRRVSYKGKKYNLNTSMKLIHALSDMYETKSIIYIDRDIPEKFYEGLVIYEVELRETLKQGLGYLKARELANKKELEYYQSKHGIEEGLALMKEENNIQQQMFAKEIETMPLENGGHKVIYNKDEILPA